MSSPMSDKWTPSCLNKVFFPALMLGCLFSQCPSDKTKFLLAQFIRFRAYSKAVPFLALWQYLVISSSLQIMRQFGNSNLNRKISVSMFSIKLKVLIVPISLDPRCITIIAGGGTSLIARETVADNSLHTIFLFPNHLIDTPLFWGPRFCPSLGPVYDGRSKKTYKFGT
jgi:hypothetical protein